MPVSPSIARRTSRHPLVTRPLSADSCRSGEFVSEVGRRPAEVELGGDPLRALASCVKVSRESEEEARATCTKQRPRVVP